MVHLALISLNLVLQQPILRFRRLLELLNPLQVRLVELHLRRCIIAVLIKHLIANVTRVGELLHLKLVLLDGICIYRGLLGWIRDRTINTLAKICLWLVSSAISSHSTRVITRRRSFADSLMPAHILARLELTAYFACSSTIAPEVLYSRQHSRSGE